MSKEHLDVIRQPLAPKARSRRHIEERLAVRFPRLLARVARAVWRLPQGSRLRRAIVRRAVVYGWAAFNRGDFDVSFALYHPNVEAITPSGVLGLGLEHTHSRAARIDLQRRWDAEFGEFQFECEELIELGDDRNLVIGRMKGSGLASGAPFEQDWSVLWTISDGLVIREETFFDRSEALEAAGLMD
jgi:ketosteroid isomerase-like protein